MTIRDPLLKQTIRNRLFALLYVPADNLEAERLQRIIMANVPLVKATHASFMYKAVNYSCDSNKILPRPRNQLHVSLEGHMAEFLVDKDELAREKPVVQSYLTRVLNTSDHPADWLRLLIPALQQPVNALLAEQSFSAKRMTDEAVEAFLAANKETSGACKRRLVTNLITV